MKYSKMRGMRDIYGARAQTLEHIVTICQKQFSCFGFTPIFTPLLEQTSLFARGIGDSSDIVSKEMYSFTDKGGREVSLRPEATAGVIRAACENNLVFGNISKFYYNYTCYRYERPQEGRYREFRQFGGEIIGAGDVYRIIELLQLAQSIFDELNIKVRIKINTLGTVEERTSFKQALVDFLRPKQEVLCQDCLRRLEKNPLRVLDCKNETCQEVISLAPRLAQFISKQGYDELDIVKSFFFNAVIDEQLVRGLDYYSGIVFEFVAPDFLSLGALGGGGAYNKLVNEIDERYDMWGCGFSFGLDRIEEIVASSQIAPVEKKLYIAPLLPAAQKNTLQILSITSKQIISVIGEVALIKKQFKEAQKYGCQYLVLIGEDEIANNLVTIKNLSNSKQISIKQSDLEKELADFINEI